jgi:hypothetical protein
MVYSVTVYECYTHVLCLVLYVTTSRWHPKRYAVQEARKAVESIRGKTQVDRLLEGDTGAGGSGGGSGKGLGGGVALTRSCGYFHQDGGGGN